ncbi:MAG: hypothetical protein AB7I30_18815 [Isosphaeraceae bacterium]
MNWRHLSLVRALSVTGLLVMALASPSATRADSDESNPRPDVVATETVSILDARKAGDLSVTVRGAGQRQVKMTLKNESDRRLQVVLPPGLVASSVAGQPGGGGGFQSMGLGSVSNRPGSFGAFRAASRPESGAFQSVGVAPNEANALVVPAGQSVELPITAVCLNYGVATPTPRDTFELVTVQDYTTDPRVRKALISLATYGSSHGVAQAAMWRVCNDVPFPVMARQAAKFMNSHEVALAARFVEVLDSSAGEELVDPAYLQDGRLFVRVIGDGALADDAARLAGEVDGLHMLGLPVRSGEEARVASPAMRINVVLTGSDAGETRGRILLERADASGQWAPLGKTSFVETSTVSVLDGAGLARAVERAVASTYVNVKPSRKDVGLTTFRVENRLPFTIGKLIVRAGTSTGAPTVEVNGLGVAPARIGVFQVAAPTVLVEGIEFNGL